MVALFFLFTIIIALTIDYGVQRRAHRMAQGARDDATATPTLAHAPSTNWAHLPEELDAPLPLSYLIDSGHTWVDLASSARGTGSSVGNAEGSPEDNDLVGVGVGALPLYLLGGAEEIRLGDPGEEVARGAPVARVRRGDREIVLRSPVSGTIAARNDAIRATPQALAQDPYATANWLVRLRPQRLGSALRQMMARDEAHSWLRRELDRCRDALVELIAPPAANALGPVAADGGLPVQGVAMELDRGTWDRLSQAIFGPEGAQQYSAASWPREVCDGSSATPAPSADVPLSPQGARRQ